LARLKPQPFREVKRRLEAAGYLEASQRGSHVKFVRRLGEIVEYRHRAEEVRDSGGHIAQYS
jgi:predicted RNA binding protein YcfA (HicA-like mRNA interferase family)